MEYSWEAGRQRATAGREPNHISQRPDALGSAEIVTAATALFTLSAARESEVNLHEAQIKVGKCGVRDRRQRVAEPEIGMKYPAVRARRSVSRLRAGVTGCAGVRSPVTAGTAKGSGAVSGVGKAAGAG